MALPASGAISLSAVNTELGLSATAAITMNDAAVRTLFGKSSGAITMNDGYGKSNSVTAALTIAANSTNYTLNPAAVSGYSAGKTTVNFTVNSSVYLYSTSTGTPALTISGFTAGDVINITNNGFILGMGGAGGSNTGGVGNAGGPAISLGFSVTIVNNNTIGGGGGGGGGGGSGFDVNFGPTYGGGGGGGRTGLTNSAGGGSPGTGSVGTVNGGGTGGAGGPPPTGQGVSGGTGGTGGTWGAVGSAGANSNGSGGAGGAAGKAINLNGYTATRSGAGTTYGAVS